jgi:beta-galactosidase
MAATPCLGVAYYPEQWPRERWEIDAELMAQAGLRMVRVGEFAWAWLEPRAGTFELDWLEEVIDVLATRGLEVILGTPTAAPPAWLVGRHPEILPVREDGRVQPFGHRRHYCPNSRAMREATERIVVALADRFGRDERVVAWQIDNELGGRCYCETCRKAFHVWLRGRYGSIEALNEAWGTIFWSQVYDDWAQVPLPEGSPVPRPRGFLRNSPNPGLALDFRRFSSDSLIDFLRLQAGSLRERCSPQQRITHNLMGFQYPEIDYRDLAEEIDVVSWDNYPLLDPTGRWSTSSLAADAMRGLKQAPVWVLEQQVGPLGWELLLTPRRGETRLLTLQAIAHGAEAVCYFRWRTARFGTEQYWHGVIDANGRVGRRYEEVSALAAELDSLGQRLAGVRPHADVALLHDYDSRFALQVQPTNPVLAYEETVQKHYESLRRLGLGVDVVLPHADLRRYRVVVAPGLFVLDEETAAALAGYVEGGGALVLAPRVGVKDRCNAVPERPVPAWLDELAGLEVVDYASVAEHATARIAGVEGVAFAGEVRGWYEELELHGGLATARYVDGVFPGSPAVVEHAVGSGRCVYVGGAADVPTLQALYRLLCGEAGLSLLDLPEGVEAVPLVANGGNLLWLLNHSDDEVVVGTVTLAPLDVVLVEAM